jgi:hypothetical protein
MANRCETLSLVTLLLLVAAAVSAAPAEAQHRSGGHAGDGARLSMVIAPGEKSAQVSQRGAFLRSLLLPGWGHYHAGGDHVQRGRFHTGADLALLGGGVGITLHAKRVESNYITFTQLNAGVDLTGRGRTFRLAVADFESLDEYNDYQLRTRNWHRLIDDTPENRWQWQSSDERREYREMRARSDRLRNQVPAIAALMVLNRVVSAISAYNRAQEVNRQAHSAPNVTLTPVLLPGSNTGTRGLGWMGQLHIRF